MTYKLGHLAGDKTVAHSHAPTFKITTSSSGTEKIMAGVPAGDPAVFRTLLRELEPPIFLLYILHTPRGEGEPARYQSDELEIREVEAFIDRFSRFLSGDGRFDIWAYSPSQSATIVWDRHNLFFGYGPIARMATALRGLGFENGSPEIPYPHVHYYRSELDPDAVELLASLDWVRSPLRPEDDQ